jgi:hypothetical protein
MDILNQCLAKERENSYQKFNDYFYKPIFEPNSAFYKLVFKS